MRNRPPCTLGQSEVHPHRLLWLLFAGMTILSATGSAADAQECTQCVVTAGVDGLVSASEWSFSKQVNEVNVLFVAMHGGKFIGDLTQSDISVRDDEKSPAAIVGFKTERELPLRVGLLVDTSSSLTPRFKFEKAGASAFLRQAVQPVSGDLGFVV